MIPSRVASAFLFAGVASAGDPQGKANLAATSALPSGPGLADAGVAGHDAVISALGLPPREALRPSNRMTEFAAATVAAMQTAQVSRLAIVSAAVLFPLTGPAAMFFRWFLRHHARDLAAMEAVVAASPFEWTIARPGRLVSSPAETYRSERSAFPPGRLSMSTRAVAAFLIDAVEQRSHCGEVVGLGAA